MKLSLLLLFCAFCKGSHSVTSTGCTTLQFTQSTHVCREHDVIAACLMLSHTEDCSWAGKMCSSVYLMLSWGRQRHTWMPSSQLLPASCGEMTCEQLFASRMCNSLQSTYILPSTGAAWVFFRIAEKAPSAPSFWSNLTALPIYDQLNVMHCPSLPLHTWKWVHWHLAEERRSTGRCGSPFLAKFGNSILIGNC